ncbi:DUF3237 domain-containing protein [Massilia niastensis]|uniref:DUF3237 domain-containing protein n=1 Tax=Massilia niastensis TaxID=544911 RepID=UPI0003A3CA67|nr:DUF3237 domain-containing protein [Massilia niastensis]
MKQYMGCLVWWAAAMSPAHAQADAPSAPALRTEFVFGARIKVDKPLVIGQSAHGLRRVVPIVGGTVSGPALTGTVVPGGADWQFVRPDGVVDVQAKYTLKADDGTLVMVDNRGVRHAPPAVLERMAKGEHVPANAYYFRTTARFEAPLGSKYEWLNRAVFIGVAERHPDAALIRFYRVD